MAPDGEIIRAVNDQQSRNADVRLTWQINDKMKFAPFLQRTWKQLGKDFAFGQDPRASVQRDPTNANNFFGTAKVTIVASSKLLIEGGYSTNFQNMTIYPQVGTSASFIEDRSNPLFYTQVQKSDTALNINPECAWSYGCTSWGSTNAGRTQAEAKVWSASMAYVTGTHNLKIGFQNSMGDDDVLNQRNGDLIAVYANNRPSSVTVYNTPVNQRAHVNTDLGIYVQDSWTIKRLTLNPGVRVQWFNASGTEVSMPAGRFAPARWYAEQEDLPKFSNDIAPRMSMAYDLFGDGRTALKASASRYFVQITGFWTKKYANSGQSSDSRSWFDCDLNAAGTACSGTALKTNNDRIVQDNEIGPSSSTTFGLRSDRNPAADIQRMNNWEYSTAVQHQLTSGMSVGFAWYRRAWKELEVTDRTLIANSDYTSFTVPMPSFANDQTIGDALNPNETLTLYNLKAAKRSAFGAALLDMSSDDQSVYNGFETSFNARFRWGTTIFGGWTVDRNLAVYCTSDDNHNGVAVTSKYINESVYKGGWFWAPRHVAVPV